MNTRLLAERIFDRIQRNQWEIIEWEGYSNEYHAIEKTEVVATIMKLLESEMANINSNPPSSLA